MATKYEYSNSESDNISIENAETFGQSFTIGTVGTNEAFTISSIKLKGKRLGSPGDIYVKLYAADGSGFPTGSALSTGTYDFDTVSTATDEVFEITMSSYELQASTQYAITLSTENYTQDEDEARLRYDFSPDSDIYAGGECIANVGMWINLKDMFGVDSVEFYFEVWGNVASTGTNFKVNIGDSWKSVAAMKVNIGDSWKDVASAKINIGDSWKEIF